MKICEVTNKKGTFRVIRTGRKNSRVILANEQGEYDKDKRHAKPEEGGSFVVPNGTLSNVREVEIADEEAAPDAS